MATAGLENYCPACLLPCATTASAPATNQQQQPGQVQSVPVWAGPASMHHEEPREVAPGASQASAVDNELASSSDQRQAEAAKKSETSSAALQGAMAPLGDIASGAEAGTIKTEQLLAWVSWFLVGLLPACWWSCVCDMFVPAPC